VLIKGTGDRAFCAGGDVRGKTSSFGNGCPFCLWSFDIILNKFTVKLMKFTEVAEAGKRGGDLSKLFFKEEYMLNYAIGE